MKKYLMLLGAIVLSIVLLACEKNDIAHEKVFEDIKLVYINNNDDEMNVTQNIAFEYVETDDVTIVITSSNDAITIEDNKLGVVTRGDVDTLVNIEISITIDELAKVYPIVLKVLKLSVDNEFIINLENITYVIGTEIPDYMETFVATFNDVDVTNDVTVDDQDVLWDEVGTYVIVFNYLDNNEEIIVNVIEPDKNGEPIINGTKDFTHIIGNTNPDYLTNVTATDYLGNTILVLLDDSEVDLNTPGTYSIHFIATDTEGNETALTHEIAVIGEDGGVGETITETFDDLKTGSSTYTTGSFIGVEGINWQYDFARTDQTLDGNALTFQHKNGGGKLYATLPNGLTYFGITAVHAFSGTADRAFALYINNELIETFYATSTIKTFEVNGLDYKEAVTLEIRNTGVERVTIDNIVIGIDNKPIEEKYLDVEVGRLSIPETFLSESIIELISNMNDVNITWEYKDINDLNNQYIDISSGQITVPEDNNMKVIVSIIAILEYEGYIVEKEFTLTIGEGEPISINEVRSSLNNSEVKTQGVITSSIKIGNKYYAYIQDNNHGLYIETNGSIVLTQGTEVILKGYKNTVNGVTYLTDIYDVQVLGEKSVNVPFVKLNNINNYIGQKISFEGYLTANTTLNTTSFSIVSIDGSINITIPNYVVVNTIDNLSKGIKVFVEGYVYDTNTIQLLNNNDIIIDDSIDEVEVKNLIINNLTLPRGDIRGNIDLPTKDLFFNTNITWMSSHDNIISDTGIFTRPDNDTNVTLYYQINFSDDVLLKGEIILTAYAVEPLMPYYASLEGLSGSIFNQELKRLIERTGRATGSTSEVRQADMYEGTNYNIYTGFGSYGNREHVWPNSKLGNAPSYDLHNLRAAVNSVNSSRSNHPFVKKPSSSSGSYQVVGQGFYPGDEHVGDVARIVLYISLRYNLDLDLVGSLEMFLDWHEQDPVNDFERSRNNNIEAIQNNRNPFIDYPEFVGMYWNVSQGYNMSSEDIILNSILNQEAYIFDNRNQLFA